MLALAVDSSEAALRALLHSDMYIESATTGIRGLLLLLLLYIHGKTYIIASDREIVKQNDKIRTKDSKMIILWVINVSYSVRPANATGISILADNVEEYVYWKPE